MQENRHKGFIILAGIILIVVAFGAGWMLQKKSSQNHRVKIQSSTQKELREGVYALVGKNPSNNEITYQGTVEIVRTGDIYDLVWRIADKQTQRGVGIMNGDILSVGYIDVTDGVIRDAGAVSYFVVSDEIIDGSWVSTLGGVIGEEHLTWTKPLSAPAN